jgi:hypothetical protein
MWRGLPVAIKTVIFQGRTMNLPGPHACAAVEIILASNAERHFVEVRSGDVRQYLGSLLMVLASERGTFMKCSLLMRQYLGASQAADQP